MRRAGGDVFAGGVAGEGAEISDHMRLVEVSAVGGEGCPTDAGVGFEFMQCALETYRSRKFFRVCTDIVGKHTVELLVTQTGGIGKCAHVRFARIY